MGSQGATKGTKMKMSGRWKNPSDFLLDFMRSYQDLAFSIRIQDGVSRDGQMDKKENVWQVGKPQRPFIGFYEVASGPHFFHQDPGLGAKGQLNGRKGKCLAGGKNPSDFLLDFMRSYQDFVFFSSGSRVGSQGTTKWTKKKMSGRWKKP